MGRYRGAYHHGDYTYPDVVELGGFHVAGPCAIAEIERRFGRGDYRVTAYSFEPPGAHSEIWPRVGRASLRPPACLRAGRSSSRDRPRPLTRVDDQETEVGGRTADQLLEQRE